jgi:hypothetical protein
MRFPLILLLTATMQFSLLTANASASESSTNESLGSQLLDDLQHGMAPKPVPAATAPNQKATEPNQTPQASPSTPESRFDDLGEDIGQPSGPLPLVRAGQGMQRATALIASSTQRSGAQAVQQAGAVQKQVVAQLDELIAQLSKQCQGGQCQPGDKPPQESQRSQPKQGQASKSAGRGKSAARDSSDQLNRPSAQPAEKGDIDALVKDLWGHLPERSREQMLQSFSTDFLPKYELEIEQYYRRLSEEQSTSGADR